MIRKKSVRIIISLFLFGLLVGMGTTALAATSWLNYGAKGYFGPYLKHNYECQAAVWVHGGTSYFVAGWTDLNETSKTNLPAGWLAAKAYLYRKDGTLLKQSSTWTTNSDIACGITVSSPYFYPQHGADEYYSKGLVRVVAAVNSSGSPTSYSTWYTQTTPVFLD